MKLVFLEVQLKRENPKKLLQSVLSVSLQISMSEILASHR